MERNLFARNEYVDHHFTELESHGSAPVDAITDPNIAKHLLMLESICVDSEAAISKRLAALELILADNIADDHDAHVTALETVVADVNAWLIDCEVN